MPAAGAPVTDLDKYRGDAPRPHQVLFYDIESAPMLTYLWDLKNSGYVNPDMVVEPPFLLCWAAKWADDDEILHGRLTGKEAKRQDDSRIVNNLAELIRQADVIVAHNGDRFDLPKLNARLAVFQAPPLGNVRTIDTLKLARSAFKFPSNRLGELAASLGIDGKFPTTFDLWRRARSGDVPALKEMDLYCRQDVLVLEAVFDLLKPYVKRLPRMVDAGQYGQRVCPSCGSSALEPDGLHRTNASSFRRFRCTECQRHCRSFRQADVPKLEMRPL
jgi:hypothetical protein